MKNVNTTSMFEDVNDIEGSKEVDITGRIYDCVDIELRDVVTNLQERIKECLFSTTFPVDFKLTKELLMESLYDYEFEVGLDSSTDETYIRGDIISDCFYRIFHNTYSTEERKYILSGVKDIYLNP